MNETRGAKDMDVDITGLDKAAVLAVLYNAAKPQGMGFLQYDPEPMTIGQAGILLVRRFLQRVPARTRARAVDRLRDHTL